ncbi:MAG: hypothetical protein IT298_16140 [Chloroflexi bacterium]|nr:hypothetical protein [Chloroflexota bacterium]RIK20096.1 MAG: hypothetical protein DCC53_11425 [Chloroflexota bacterium]
MTSIACVVIEDFAAAAHGIAGALPSVLVDYRQRRARIAAAAPAARAAGVAPGLSLTRARALCPQLTAHPLKPDRIEQLRERTLNALWTFTNRIEPAGDRMPQTATLWLDLGPTRDDDARHIGAQIGTAMQRLGLAAKVGIARGKFTALAAAGQAACGVQLISHGAARDFLAPLPITLLPLEREDARKLDLLGIRTLGQFADLPRSAVSAQFGRRGRLWHLLASGNDSRRVKPARMPDFEHAGADFEDAVADMLTLDNVLSTLAVTLARRLESRAAAAHEIALTVHLERGATHVERIQRVQPYSDCGELRRALFDLLDKAKVAEPVGALSVSLNHLNAAIPRQLGLFTQRPRQQAVLKLSAELSRRYGPCFFTAELHDDGLLPERRFRLITVQAEDAS